MQHYGMPTRLLDVSRNPLVAIFFACNNMDCTSQDGTLYIFKPEKNKVLNFEDGKLKCLMKIIETDNNDRICEECITRSVCRNDISNRGNGKVELPKFFSENWFVRGVAKNQRIYNQSGDFIFVGLNGSQDKLNDLVDTTIIIDNKSKKVLLEQLESLNIHGGAVYPDLAHMSTYIKHKYQNAKKVETSWSGGLPELLPDDSTKKEFNFEIENGTPINAQTGRPDAKIFNFNKIKNVKRQSQLEIFSEYYNLDIEGLNKVVDDYLFTEKRPFMDEVANIMLDKPSKIKDRSLIEQTIDKIITFAKLLSNK
jgi:hypothetical protein